MCRHCLQGCVFYLVWNIDVSQPFYRSCEKHPLAFSQVFEGNTHFDTPEIRRFEETVAQFIRIYPERWSPAGIGMRLEVLGCDLPGKTAAGSMCSGVTLISEACPAFLVTMETRAKSETLVH